MLLLRRALLLACRVSFFFLATRTTEIYTLSLHDALPISVAACKAGASAFGSRGAPRGNRVVVSVMPGITETTTDRKSTRLNSSHRCISYAVFCLKKKKQNKRARYMKQQ